MEEIIINDVDVSGCEFYQIEANDLYPKLQYCGSMRNTFCENEPNCYYKQLKRKEKELEQYKASKQASYEEMQRRWNKVELENRELKQECEELKQLLKTSCNHYAPGGECSLTAHNCPGTAKCINRYREALQEIKETLEYYANSTLGELQDDGTYKYFISERQQPTVQATGVTYPREILTYDPRPAKEALKKISEVEE